MLGLETIIMILCSIGLMVTRATLNLEVAKILAIVLVVDFVFIAITVCSNKEKRLK